MNATEITICPPAIAQGALVNPITREEVAAARRVYFAPLRAAAKPKVAPKTDGKTITVLAETNPKKPGSASYLRFELYRSGMTVDEFRAAGGKTADLRWDAERGFIALS